MDISDHSDGSVSLADNTITAPPFLFSHAQTTCSNNSSNNNNNDMIVPAPKFRHDRYPKMMPDLKLAESYIPAVFVWVKGMVYGILSVVGCHFILLSPSSQTQQQSSSILIAALCKYMTLIPFIVLYYDRIIMKCIRYTNHLTTTLFYIDSTSISLDIVVSTLITQLKYINVNCCGVIGNGVSLLWTVLGCTHVFFGDTYISQRSGHFVVVFVLTLLLLFSVFFHRVL